MPEKPKEPEEPEEVRNLINELEDKFNLVKELRKPYETYWYQNAAFFFGKQWVTWNKDKHQLELKEAPSWRVRLTINLIFPIVRIMLGKLNKVKLSLVCMPKTKEKEDISAAQIGSKVLEYLIQKLNFGIKQLQLYLLTVIFGISYIKNFWDGDTGTKFNVKEIDEKGEKEIELTLGDVDSTVLTPFDLYFDPTVTTDLQEAEYIFETKIRSIKYVKEKYGIDVKPDETIYPSTIEQQIHYLLDKRLQPTKHKLCLVKEYWEKPSKEYPEGRHIIYSGREILFYENMLDSYKFYPYVEFIYFPTFSEIYPITLIQTLIPLQKEYNKSRSQIIEHKNLMSKGKWLIPEGCKVSRNSFTSEPGEKIYYDSRYGTPTQLPIQPLPNYIWQNIAHIRNEMFDTAGIHEVSQARIPSGIRSGIAIAFLQEQDDTQLGTLLFLFQRSFEKVGHQLLEIVKDNYIENRLIKISGREKETDVFYFKGSDLKNNTDVQVEIGTTMPFSKLARQQFVMELYTRGIIPDRQEVRKILEFSTKEDVFDENALDEGNAKVENEEMAQGIQSIAQIWDNHQIHITIHNQYRKDRAFLQLPNNRQQLFQVHIQAHEDLLLAEMQKAQAIMGLQQTVMPLPITPTRTPVRRQQPGI